MRRAKSQHIPAYTDLSVAIWIPEHYRDRGGGNGRGCG